MPATTSVRLTDEAKAQLAALTAATGRSQSWLLSQAITRYLEEEAWQLQAIDEGLQDAEEGRLISTAAASAEILHRGWVTEADLAAPDPTPLEEYLQANR